jgi:hypothetical protein
MKRTVSVAMISVAFAFLSASLLAQPPGPAWWRGSGGWGMHAPFGRIYNPNTIQTVSGEVTSVDLVPMMHGMHQGVHLTLKTNGETQTVVLGPEWYIAGQDTKIAKGDKVQVTGSKVQWAGKPLIIASQIKKGDQVLVLRDQNGFPAWMGWRQRPAQQLLQPVQPSG